MSLWLISSIIGLHTTVNNGMTAAIDLVEAAQGVIITLLFVLNKQTREQIIRAIKLKLQKDRIPAMENNVILLDEFR